MSKWMWLIVTVVAYGLVLMLIGMPENLYGHIGILIVIVLLEKLIAETFDSVIKGKKVDRLMNTPTLKTERLKNINVPIGYMNVDMGEAHDFGYGLSIKYWHQGIVSEAGKAVIEQVKKDGIPFITATHDKNNPRSGHVMQKLGMKYCYSYVEKWQPKDISVTFRMYQLNFDDSEDVYKKYWDRYEEHFIEVF